MNPITVIFTLAVVASVSSMPQGGLDPRFDPVAGGFLDPTLIRQTNSIVNDNSAALNDANALVRQIGNQDLRNTAAANQAAADQAAAIRQLAALREADAARNSAAILQRAANTAARRGANTDAQTNAQVSIINAGAARDAIINQAAADAQIATITANGNAAVLSQVNEISAQAGAVPGGVVDLNAANLPLRFGDLAFNQFGNLNPAQLADLLIAARQNNLPVGFAGLRGPPGFPIPFNPVTIAPPTTSTTAASSTTTTAATTTSATTTTAATTTSTTAAPAVTTTTTTPPQTEAPTTTTTTAQPVIGILASIYDRLGELNDITAAAGILPFPGIPGNSTLAEVSAANTARNNEAARTAGEISGSNTAAFRNANAISTANIAAANDADALAEQISLQSLQAREGAAQAAADQAAAINNLAAVRRATFDANRAIISQRARNNAVRRRINSAAQLVSQVSAIRNGSFRDAAIIQAADDTLASRIADNANDAIRSQAAAINAGIPTTIVNQTAFDEALLANVGLRLRLRTFAAL